MLRVATVLSAREWEARFVAAARDSAAVRLVLRAYMPDEVSQQAEGIDVVVAGAETPWVTATRIAGWRRLGLRVVGVHQHHDAPAVDRLTAGGADLVLHESLDPDAMVREVRLLEVIGRHDVARQGSVTVVTGPRGAPGRTEIAVGLAWVSSGCRATTLVDADLGGPGVAIRFGLPVRPDLGDCVDSTIAGSDPGDVMHRVGRMAVAVGSHRSDTLNRDGVADVIERCAATAHVIVDVGPWEESQILIRAADTVVFVVDASPLGVVRASRIVDDWVSSTPPLLLLNRVGRRRGRDLTTAVRRWTGLDPLAVIPEQRAIRRRAAGASDPSPRLLRALRPFDELVGAADA
jgi:MinD-like ATPase involved in chromosome partitioning or flagellar assembly